MNSLLTEEMRKRILVVAAGEKKTGFSRYRPALPARDRETEHPMSLTNFPLTIKIEINGGSSQMNRMHSTEEKISYHFKHF